MKLIEIESTVFYHGSNDKLSVGAILRPSPDYEENWKNTNFYSVLEHYRPPNVLSHKDAVFMCDNADDVDLAGGGTEWLFTVIPLGPVERHDLNWSSEISGLIDDGADINSVEVQQAASNYWNGVPHHDESVWEYLTPLAKIIKVEKY